MNNSAAVRRLPGKDQSFVGRFAENCIEENYFANKMFFSSKGIVRGKQSIFGDSEAEEAAPKIPRC